MTVTRAERIASRVQLHYGIWQHDPSELCGWKTTLRTRQPATLVIDIGVRTPNQCMSALMMHMCAPVHDTHALAALATLDMLKIMQHVHTHSARAFACGMLSSSLYSTMG